MFLTGDKKHGSNTGLYKICYKYIFMNLEVPVRQMETNAFRLLQVLLSNWSLFTACECPKASLHGFNMCPHSHVLGTGEAWKSPQNQNVHEVQQVPLTLLKAKMINTFIYACNPKSKSGPFFISDDNLISCSLSSLVCIEEFTYRSICGKVFAK